MTATSFVLIVTAPGFEHDVHSALREINEIEDVHALFGEYDIMAKVRGDNFGDIGEIVVDKIRTIEGVLDTKTLTGMKLSG